MTRNVLIAVLIGVNLLLLVGLVLATSSPAPAYAQDAAPAAAPGLARNYMFTSGEIQDQYDAVYMIDTNTRKLYAFLYDRGSKQLELTAGRDLKRDFRNEGK